LAGGVSRSVAQMSLYPIDAMRTLAQTRDGRTLRDVGARALLRGCTTTSVFALLMGSIQFAIFDACRDTVGPLLASAAGAVSSCVISVPQEVIKQRLVTGIYPSFRKAVSAIYSTEGVRGFYNSWGPTMARNVPFVMTVFLSQDLFTRWRLKRLNDGRDELSLSEHMIFGMSSALIGVLVTHPADVIKTRMMTQATSAQLPYTSAVNCFATMMKKEGPLALLSGVRQRCAYICLLWGATFAMNGKIKECLKDFK
jgi:solute carrier family 25 S-adenosylmethionine transporter 26